MSTRRSSVMLFVFSFRVTYVLLFVAWCASGGRGVFVSLRPMACQFYDFFIVLSLLSSSRRLCRLSANLTARAYIRVVMLPVFIMTLVNFIICQFAALLPLVTSQAWLRSDVLEPQPGVTAGESRMFLAQGVLDRFPAVNSASLHRLGYI